MKSIVAIFITFQVALAVASPNLSVIPSKTHHSLTLQKREKKQKSMLKNQSFNKQERFGRWSRILNRILVWSFLLGLIALAIFARGILQIIALSVLGILIMASILLIILLMNINTEF
jgi:hypothetical protein